MKKTVLSAMAAIALLMGGYTTAFAEEPCNNTTECSTPACQANEGFETIGEGVSNAAEGSYNYVKEGTENTYEKAENGVEKGYNVVKEGTVNTYEKAKEGTVNTYEKAKNGVENLWDKTKEKIHNATE